MDVKMLLLHNLGRLSSVRSDQLKIHEDHSVNYFMIYASHRGPLLVRIDLVPSTACRERHDTVY